MGAVIHKLNPNVQVMTKTVRRGTEFQVERHWTTRGWRVRYRYDGKIVSKDDYGKLLLLAL